MSTIHACNPSRCGVPNTKKGCIAKEGKVKKEAINLGASAIDPKTWVRKWDAAGEFIQAEVLILIDSITDMSADGQGNRKHLTPAQAFQLMRMFRLAGCLTAEGTKWRIIDRRWS